MSAAKTIWTIGHSTRTFEEFVTLLRAHDIMILADVRSFPGSKRYPHFNEEQLQGALNHDQIEYIHIPELGGRRKTLAESKNTGWRNDSFRGYADYMETNDFREGIKKLQVTALKAPTAFMCSEAVWWRCHRSLISDYLKHERWRVIHILSLNKSEEHPYTTVARIVNGKLSYGEQGIQAKLDL